MPRYYFHLVHPDAPPVPDDEGLELEDDAIAKREALESIRDLIAESISNELKPIHVSIEIVRDGSGVVARLTGELAIHSPH